MENYSVPLGNCQVVFRDLYPHVLTKDFYNRRECAADERFGILREVALGALNNIL